ncbi:MAG TPA: cold shock domain-containing protein [Candidatus Nanoperiomorbaceae bacterium]|nr:cold shock domain-containing protein [Candidatus Nanoperiomorbaceae bacterium]
MRHQGKVKTWKDDKGFGFISPNDDSSDIFLHISSFTGRIKRPAVNDNVTYEIVSDDKGRQQAINVMFVGQKSKRSSANRFELSSLIFPILALSVIGYIGYIRLSHPGSSIQASAYKAIFARDALHNQNSYQCSGKKYCSEMTSCSEAFFYQENCPETKMDGDNDGIPCERQWCN